MDLVRDLLDEQLGDRHGGAMGKVDGIILEVTPGHPPTVVGIEVGVTTLLRRIHPVFGRWMVALMKRLGVGGGDPLRVSLDKLRMHDGELRADVDRERTPAYAWERWVRRRIIAKIPGSGL